MSYEDFIEGIKPVEPEKEGDSLIYKIQLGIFRKISKDSYYNLIRSKNNTALKEPFEKIFNELITPIKEGKELKIEMRTSSFKITEITEKTIYFEKQSESSSHSLSIATLKKMYDNNKNDIIIGGLQPYYNPLLEKLLEKSKELSKSKKQEELKNFVIIIDEINRGNVSQIFGELITLIEEDKRIGNKEALEVTLPYSKEKFGVPSNLYIIGTMNTADRSVEALDTALRRRFTFEEMPPRYDLPELEREIEGVKLLKILETINKRIEKLLDKDHLIGHSFFINVQTAEDLRNTFYKNIIPLLQEYFFGDYGKIGLILGLDFVSKKENDKIFSDFDYDEVDNLNEKIIYEIKYYRKDDIEKFKNAVKNLVN